MPRNVTYTRKRKRRTGRIYIIYFYLICLTVLICVVVNLQNRDFNKQYISQTTSEYRNNDKKDESNRTDTDKKDIQEDWYLTLVNKWNPIQSENDIEVNELSNGEFVDKRIYPYLQKMFDAARNEGIYPIVASGYRTEQEQEEIYSEKIAAYKAEGLSAADAKREAELWVAVPGTSEHQLGLAVDINADGIHSVGTDVYRWLKKNAHLYGFILRYPPEKTDLTGVSNEPWHYRYVGVDAAAEIFNKGICLEEYIETKGK